MKQNLLTVGILLVAVPVFVICGSLLLLISIVRPVRLHRAARLAVRIILFSMGVKVRITGKLPPPQTRYILMANHSSFIDPLLLPLVLQGKYTGIVADFNFRYPLWATILKRYRVIRIDRKNSDQAIENIRTAEHLIKTEGYNIAILPEGTRTLTGKMSPLKKGGFYLAVNTGVPILPVGIEGAFQFKPKNRFAFKPRAVTLNIGSLLQVEKNNTEGIPALMDKIEKALKKLSGESV